MQYQDSGVLASGTHHGVEAACAVCELGHWESVYTQWGRSSTCSNEHQTLYTGFVMSSYLYYYKSDFTCVDSERAASLYSNSGDNNGGGLYSTEMVVPTGSSMWGKADAPYRSNAEVGCVVCASEKEVSEVPFVRKTFIGPDGHEYPKNAIHGEWVKIAALTTGKDVT